MESKNEFSKINVNVRLELFNEAGEIKSVQQVHNAVLTAGKNGIADQVLASPTLSKPGWCELGTGTGGTTLLAAYH